MFGLIPSAIGGGGQDDGIELQFVVQRVRLAVGMSGSLVWHGKGVLYGKWCGMADVMAWHFGFGVAVGGWREMACTRDVCWHNGSAGVARA